MLLLICKSGTADVSLYSTHSIVLVEKALCVCSAYTFLFLYVGFIRSSYDLVIDLFHLLL